MRLPCTLRSVVGAQILDDGEEAGASVPTQRVREHLFHAHQLVFSAGREDGMDGDGLGAADRVGGVGGWVVDGGTVQVGRVEVAGKRGHDGVAFGVGIDGATVEIGGVVWVGVEEGGRVGGDGCFCGRDRQHGTV